MNDDILLGLESVKRMRGPRARRACHQISEGVSMTTLMTMVRKRLRINNQWRRYHKEWLERFDIEDKNCRYAFKALRDEKKRGRRVSDRVCRELVLSVCNVDKAHKYRPGRLLGKSRMTVAEKKKWYAAQSAPVVTTKPLTLPQEFQ